MHDPALPQVGEQVDRAGQRPPVGEQLAEDPPVPPLERLGLLRRQLPPHLARDGAREEAAAHPDPPVDPPPVDRHPLLRQRALPREDVRVDGVDERPVEIEDQRRHESLAITCFSCVYSSSE